MSAIEIPRELIPADGRFGSGPSKVRPEAVQRLARDADDLLGTSHRQPAVKGQVRRVREGLRTFFDLPDDHEVVLGVGGATLFWDAAVFGLIRERSAHAVFGEFSTKFAKSVDEAPHLADPVKFESDFGTFPEVEAVEGVDLYALTHCETSTGVAMPVQRPAGSGDALVAVDATSAAGGLPVDPSQYDAYYFSPQKAFASEGGLWLALLSPAAIERIGELSGSRYQPPILDLQTALDNSRKDQTYNTPSVSTLYLMGEQLDWLNSEGGLGFAVENCAAKANHLYDWASRADFAQPFVKEPGERSNVVVTVDLDARVDANEVASTLRENGILDTEAYRKLGRNQLRFAVFPAVDHDDVVKLTAAIDHVVERLAE
ncbi:phosphoserine transaminase [Egibacter rhizosphaerae]|uniref:phosphoserine transaminase n=1 Tax=Egibacter rhizosphaerae TaxID=1670831 RepID=A0A411YKE1_9ACTN|nr:phosphoserine transaminase [Egibacter rhizosphaerae]QBI21656.1 phosphoserine transaminase [Egibacter rhizosphaerae]